MDSCGPVSHLRESTISDLEFPIEFSSQRKTILNRFINKEIGLLWSSKSFEGKYNIEFKNPIKFPSQRKKIFKSVHKQGNWNIVVQWVIRGKVRYRIWNLHRISKSKKNIYSNRSINKEIGLLWSRESFEESIISDLESPSNFQVKENKLFKSIQKQRNYVLTKNDKIVMFK